MRADWSAEVAFVYFMCKVNKKTYPYMRVRVEGGVHGKNLWEEKSAHNF
jgi:hypothetical protein